VRVRNRNRRADLRAEEWEMAEPYRESAAPPPCSHRRAVATTLKGGEGLDDAEAFLTCPDCGATGWKYMARRYTPASVKWNK
jgi:hypothetical protein